MKRLITLFVIIAFTLAGCGAYGSSSAPRETPQAVPPSSGEIGISVSYARFQPSRIEIGKDKVAHLKFTSTDMNHTFTVDELGIDVSIPAGKSASQDVTVNRTGIFSFYCAVPGHRQAGMQGSLEIK